MRNRVSGTYSAKFAWTRIARSSSGCLPSPTATRSLRRTPMVRMLRTKNTNPRMAEYKGVMGMRIVSREC